MDNKRLVTGIGAWHIGTIHVADGPHGVRSQEDGAKNNNSFEATCFPTASCVACSFDKELIRKMAKGIASEAKDLGVSVVLGPGVNIKRSPLCGRNFEYYSEDPYLAGEMASNYISAMQELNVGTSLKHFAANNQETHRMTSNSMIDDRALHEIYLSAFRRAVKKAHPATIMASYNYLNGYPACENKHLLTDILRDKWGYSGVVMSDWGACVDLPACINAGMDVEMPDSLGMHDEDLNNAIEKKTLSEETLNTTISRIEKLIEKYGKDVHNKKAVEKETRLQNHILARKIACESQVLLKNEGILPIKQRNILVIGDLAKKPRFQGGGSSHINTAHVDSFFESMSEQGVTTKFARGYNADSFKRKGKLEREALKAAKEAADKKIPIVFFGGLTDKAEGEGYDRTTFNMPYNQESLLNKLFEITTNIVFVSVSGSPYNMELPARCKGLLQAYLSGEGAMYAIANILTGKITPSGKLAETIPLKESDVASYGYFAKQEEQSDHVDDVEYRESIFVGYRYYNTYDVPVRFPFGYGLSYTKFEYSDLHVKPLENNEYEVGFTVKNTGNVNGAEIAQVYVIKPNDGSFRPNMELRGFEKVFLKVNESKQLKVVLDNEAFSAYTNGDINTIGGTYEIVVASSINDIRLKENITIAGEKLVSPLTIRNKVPLCEEDFDKIYTYPKTHFSNLCRGEFTFKNSLTQVMPYSRKAKRLSRLGKWLVRIMFFPKPITDPEARMMYEGLMEGSLDSVVNQSGGMIKKKKIIKILSEANKIR